MSTDSQDTTSDQTEDDGNITAEQWAALGFGKDATTIETVTPAACLALAMKAARRLKSVQEMVSALLAGPFALEIRKATGSDETKRWYDTQELIVHGEWGTMKFGIRRWSSLAMDELLRLLGGIKLVLKKSGSKQYTHVEDNTDPFPVFSP